MRASWIVLLLLALSARNVRCEPDDGLGEHNDDPDYDPDGAYGGGDDDYDGADSHADEDHGSEGTDSGGQKELLTAADFDEFLDDADASVIAAFSVKEMPDPTATKPEGWDDDEDGAWSAPTIENPQFEAFKSIAASAYGYRYAYTFAPEVLEKLKQKSSLGLYIYRSPKFLSKEHGDRVRERFPSDKLTTSAVENWLATKTQPLVGQYSSATKDRYKASTLIIFMNLDFDNNAKGVQYVLKRARKAAVALKGKLSIAVASLSDMNYDLADYGLTSTKPKSDILMGIRASNAYDAKTYAVPEGTAFTATALTTFAEDYLAGKLTAFVKPDPPPPPPYEDNGDDDEYGDADPDGADSGEDKDEM
jgi:hypothetical protein